MESAALAEQKQLAAETVAFAGNEGSYLEAGTDMDRVRSWAVTMGYLRDGPLQVAFLGEPESDPDSSQAYEVWVPVSLAARTTPEDPIQIKSVPSVMAMVRTIRGPFDPLQVGPLYHETASWLTEHGYARSGPARWIYTMDPLRAQRPEDLVMELAFPVASQGKPEA